VPLRRQRKQPSDWLDSVSCGSTNPRAIAHRGASGHAPENTLAAFVLAADMGADGIELDVHLTADGEVVVIHNDTVDATTNGRGRVSQMTLGELQALDAGGWYSARYADERIPTLAEVFEAVGQRTLINVEIKVEKDVHLARERRPEQLETELVRLIDDHKMSKSVLISCFSPAPLVRVRRLSPGLPLGFLCARSPGRSHLWLPRLIRTWVVEYDALHPALTMVDSACIAWARRHRLPMHVWTVNAVQDMQRMCVLDIEGIITNYPDRLKKVLSRQPSPSGLSND
jgi:glycerophosphoryl diester phosphodiesterase